MAKVGRPPKYKKAEEMQKKIEEYFETTEIPSIAEMAWFLGFEDRQSLLDYSKKPEFSCTIKRAKLLIEAYLEKYLISGASPSGAIFNLKNNFGWKDKQEQTVSFVNHEDALNDLE